MDHPAHHSAWVQWSTYGVRDALIFGTGFILALLLAAPFT